MPAPFAELEQRMSTAVYAGLANVTVTPDVGEPFDAILDVADQLDYETVARASHELRAPSASVAGWQEGTLVPIGAVTYRAVMAPMRINADESRVPLAIPRAVAGGGE